MVTLRGLTPDDAARLGPLVRDASLREAFDDLVPEGRLAHRFADPHFHLAGGVVAESSGEPVGFGFSVLLGGAESPWAFVQVGVRGDHRRRGLGTRLVEHVTSRQRELPQAERPREQVVGAYLPSPEAEGFVAKLGFRHGRYYWRMMRLPDRTLAVSWPPGVTAREFDGGESALADWNAIYNDSFAEHHRFVRSTLDLARELTKAPDFERRDLMLAYRDGRVVGFCRNEAIGDMGYIGTLGVTRSARGIGLGRALLRWGVRDLSERGFAKVALMVDGENESALGLYRSEDFVVERTRSLWERALP